MDRTRLGARAAVAGLAIDGLVIGFQVALAAGAPWGSAAWGGAHPGTLPTNLRVASAASAGVWTGIALLTARRGGRPVPALVPTLVPDRALATVLWGLTGLSALGVVLNLATPSPVERALWAPVSAASTVALALTAAWGPGGRRTDRGG